MMIRKALQIFLLCMMFFILDSCTDCSIVFSNNGTKVKSCLEYNALNDPHPYKKYVIYHNHKIICSNCRKYFISPDSKLIIYLKRPEKRVRGEKIEIFDNVKNDRKELLYIFNPIDISDKVQWYKDKVIFTMGPKKKKWNYIIYFDEGVIEITGTKTEIELYEYLVFLMNKLYRTIDTDTRQRFNDLFRYFINLEPGGGKYGNNERISSESWDKIGEVCSNILQKLKGNYRNSLVYSILDRSFKEYFVKKDNQWIIHRDRFD